MKYLDHFRRRLRAQHQYCRYCGEVLTPHLQPFGFDPETGRRRWVTYLICGQYTPKQFVHDRILETPVDWA